MLQLVEDEGIDRFYFSHLNYAGRGNKNRADDARNLLTYGFAADVLTHIPVASLRRALRQLVMARTQAASLGDLA